MLLEQLKETTKLYKDNVALVDYKGQMTYGELFKQAQRIAHRLKSSGIKKGDYITIELPKINNYIATMLATWMVGAAFAALGNGYPAERIDFIVKDCQAKLRIDEKYLENIDKEEPLEEFEKIELDDPSLLVYTSGSTGNPKGVLHTHRSLLAGVERGKIVVKSTCIKELVGKHFGETAPLSFVAGLALVFFCLCEGMALYLIPNEVIRDAGLLSTYFYHNKIDLAFIPPKLLKVFENKGDKLKLVITGSEKVTNIYREDFEIYNAYGSSESTGGVLYFKIDKEYENTPVGKSFGAEKVYVLGDDNKEAEEGELCLTGHFATKYLNLKEESEKTFVDNPFKDKDGFDKMLRTGDIIRRLPDDNILYLNRKDWLIKINGQRVEPGEIEQAIRQIPGVFDVAVKDFVNPIGQTHICAYYVEKEGESIDLEKAKDFLIKKLPVYMIPSYFQKLDKLPVNANGKLDRKALPAPDFSSVRAEYVAPKDELEKKLCKGFQKILNIDKIGVHDDFFHLGGDSIRVMSLQQLLPNLGLTTKLIYEHRTIKKIVEMLKKHKQKEIEKADLSKTYPLTQAQIGIFLESIKKEGEPVYNNPILLAFPKKTNLEILVSAIEKTVRAHPGLAASICVDEHNNPAMRYNPEFIKSPICTYEKMSEKQFEEIKGQLEKPFYLLKDRLFRFRVIKTEKHSYLFVDIHHIIFDGFSMHVLFEDIFDIYEGKSISKESYNAFDEALRDYHDRTSDNHEVAKTWYLNTFKDVKKVSLPEGDTNESETRFGATRVELNINSEDLLMYCREHKTTENTLTTSAFGLLLSAYTYSKEAAFATIYNGRHDLTTERTISMFVRTLPVLAKIDPEANVANYLEQMKQQLMGAMTNDCFCFAEVSAATGYTSDVLFSWQGGIFVLPTFKDGEIKKVDLPFNATGEKLCIQVYPANGKIEVNAQYHANIYSEEWIKEFIKAYEKTLKNLLIKDKIKNVSLLEERLQNKEQLDNAKAWFDSLLQGKDTDYLPVSDGNIKDKGYQELDLDYEINNSLVKDNAESLWISSFGIALARLLNRKDVIFATSNNKNQLLPVVSEPFEYESSEEYVEDIQKQIEESSKYSIYKFSKLSKDYGIRPDIILNVDKRLHKKDTVISISFEANEKGYHVHVKYDGSKYEEWSVLSLIESTIASFKALLNKTKPIEISFIDKKMRKELDEFNKTSINIPNESLVDLFKQSVKEHGDNIAVIFKDEKLTYKQLDDLTNRIATYLHSQGIGKGKVVSIMVSRSLNMVISPLAVLKTGAAYQPLDSSYPTERLEFMIKDANASMLIADKELLEKIPNNNIPVLLTNDFDTLKDKSDKLKGPAHDDLMILLYTSGTTGVPKGVMLTHSNLVNFSHWYISYYKLEPSSVVAAYAGFGFDACMMDLYPALSNGSTVCVVPEELRMNLGQLKEYFGEHKVSHAFMTTQVGRMFAEENDECYSLKHLSVGGEKLAPLSKVPSGYKFYNGYGPTECTVFSTIQEYDKDYERIPIGGALSNYKLYVVGFDNKEVPVGFLGELYISGKGVGLGYLNQKEKTEASFTKNEFLNEKGFERVYHTGDIVRRLPNGTIDFIGRNDGQVKIRGYRIELLEVEMVIRSYPGIKDATVQAFKDETSGGMYLAAYFTANEKIDVDFIKAFIQKQKPSYMVPSSIMQLDAIPLNQNQKVNKNALPKPIYNADAGEYVEPTDPLEKEIADIFKNVLGNEKVGATDNFFEIGGTSISAAKVVMFALNKGYTIAYKDVFDNPTPRALAKIISSHLNNQQVEIKDEEEEIIEHPSLKYNNVKYVGDIKEDKELGTVLLTGSTGFLGIHILKELIYNQIPTIALVRSKDVDSLTRLKGMLAYYFDSPLEEEVKKYIKVIDGDITDASFIETASKYEFNTIINAAACVKHFANDDVIERINVKGVESLIELAKLKKARLIQISTLSVAGDNIDHKFDSSYQMKENQLYFGQDLSNKYINSKFKAEEAVLTAIEKDGLDAKIIRVGNLMGRQSDGEFQINSITNAFMRTLKAYKYLGKFPVSSLDNETDFSPIDETAKSIILLAKTPQKFTVFHSMNSHLVQMGDVVDMMNSAGITIEKVSDEDFQKAVQEVLSDESRSMHVSSLFSYAINDNHSHELIQSANDFTVKALYRLGFRWPITDFEYLLKSVKSLQELDFFDRDDI